MDISSLKIASINKNNIMNWLWRELCARTARTRTNSKIAKVWKTIDIDRCGPLHIAYAFECKRMPWFYQVRCERLSLVSVSRILCNRGPLFLATLPISLNKVWIIHFNCHSISSVDARNRPIEMHQGTIINEHTSHSCGFVWVAPFWSRYANVQVRQVAPRRYSFELCAFVFFFSHIFRVPRSNALTESRSMWNAKEMPPDVCVLPFLWAAKRAIDNDDVYFSVWARQHIRRPYMDDVAMIDSSWQISLSREQSFNLRCNRTWIDAYRAAAT